MIANVRRRPITPLVEIAPRRAGTVSCINRLHPRHFFKPSFWIDGRSAGYLIKRWHARVSS
jgi:hypothetical protein